LTKPNLLFTKVNSTPVYRLKWRIGVNSCDSEWEESCNEEEITLYRKKERKIIRNPKE
jgi:hypothetical protein